MDYKEEVQQLINDRLNTMKSLAIEFDVSVPTLMKAQKGELTNIKTLGYLWMRLTEVK